MERSFQHACTTRSLVLKHILLRLVHLTCQNVPPASAAAPLRLPLAPLASPPSDVSALPCDQLSNAVAIGYQTWEINAHFTKSENKRARPCMGGHPAGPLQPPGRLTVIPGPARLGSAGPPPLLWAVWAAAIEPPGHFLMWELLVRPTDGNTCSLLLRGGRWAPSHHLDFALIRPASRLPAAAAATVDGR